MASMGRMRRRMAVCSLLQLISAQLCPVLLELKHIAQIMTVAMRALKETPQVEVRPTPTSKRDVKTVSICQGGHPPLHCALLSHALMTVLGSIQVQTGKPER